MNKVEIFEYAIYGSVTLGYLFWALSIRRPRWGRWSFLICTFSTWLAAGALLYSDIDREFTGFFLANLAFQLLLVARERYQVPN